MTKLTTLPPFLQDLLASPPRAGEGVHAWLFRLARQLHAHFPAVEIIRLLELAVANCGRHVPRSEIEDAVKNSIGCAWQPTGGARPTKPATSKWPAVNQKEREAITLDGPGLADLWESSAIRIEDNEQHTEALVDQLFPGNPLLCVGDPITLPDGEPSQAFDTKSRDDWRGNLAEHSLIVPSPMSAAMGTTQKGYKSKHTLDNTGPRHSSCWNSTRAPPMRHAALLSHLASYGPLVWPSTSGNKSLHGWFYCAGQSEEKLFRFMRYAVSLGADDATWSRCQFVRMPGRKTE